MTGWTIFFTTLLLVGVIVLAIGIYDQRSGQ